MTRRRAWRTLLFAVSLVAAANTDSRAEPLVVPMRLGDVGTERELLEQLLIQARLDCPGEDLTFENFLVGRADLDDDGMYELIVNFAHICFGGNCSEKTPIYRRYHGEWVEIADLDGVNHDISEVAHLLTDERADRGPAWDYVTVLEKKIGGWRSIVGGNYALRWSNLGIGQYGGDYDRPAEPGYHRFCASDYCQNVCFAEVAGACLSDLPYENSGER